VFKMAKINLKTHISGIEIKHPVMIGSGVLNDQPNLIERAIIEGEPSAVVTKTITWEPREGYQPPIIIELSQGGYLNAVGLANPGRNAIPSLVEVGHRYGVPVIVSIAGSSLKEFIDLAILAEEYRSIAIELNLSCPHVKGLGAELGRDPKMVYTITKDTSSVVKIPILAKLGPWDNVVEISSKALEGGAKALVLINTIKGMAIDIYVMKPILSNVIGGLSGPPLHPIAIRIVYEVYRELKPEIIGVGGVVNYETAIEFLLAGAKAVQVVSAIIKNGFRVVRDIVSGIESYLKFMNLKSIDEIIGAAHKF